MVVPEELEIPAAAVAAAVAVEVLPPPGQWVVEMPAKRAAAARLLVAPPVMPVLAAPGAWRPHP
jgi:hypothetical protein